MQRREFITLLGGAAAASPLAARAQQPQMPVVGVLNGRAPADSLLGDVTAYRQGLADTGYVDGRNVAIEFHWAEGRYDRLPGLAADLVRRRVAVIFAVGAPAVLPAKAATTTIPIVFTMGDDPVTLGVVASLNRPGGNITGVSRLNAELMPKRLELLHEVVPKTAVIALLINPLNPNAEPNILDVQGAARLLGRQIRILRARTDSEIEAAFAALGQLGAGALLISTDTFFNGRSEQLGALAAHHGVPAMYQLREFVVAGGLMSYGGPSLADAHRLAGVYTGRVLKGEKPADLPVQQETKVELIVNLKTARALGVTVPLPLLARADEVIE